MEAHDLMGPMVDRILKIPCKFQMANHKVKSEENQGSNATIGAIYLGWVCKFIVQAPTFEMGLKEEEPTLIHVIQATNGGSIA
jgi:hypothetical protein